MYVGQCDGFKNIIPALLVLLACSSEVTASPMCLMGDFESQIQSILRDQMRTKAEVANLSGVFHELQASLQMRWPGSLVIPIGSLMAGLAMKTSDADCIVQVPHFDIYNETADRFLIMQSVALLKRQPKLYTKVRGKFEVNATGLLKFIYVPTQQKCDVNFIITNGLNISKLVGNYYRLDNRAWAVGAIVKLWSKVHLTKRAGRLTSYGLNLLIIFYLQQENVLPPYYILQNTQRRSFDNWRKNQNRLADDLSVYQLLSGFFRYYNEFNYKEYVVSAFLGRPINKRLFEDIDSLPEELYLYKNYMRSPNSTPLPTNTTMSIQNALSLELNSEDVTPEIFDNFIFHVRSAADKFERLPSDQVLTAILLIDDMNKEYLKLVSQVCVNINKNVTNYYKTINITGRNIVYNIR